jgi:hypothetical protein
VYKRMPTMLTTSQRNVIVAVLAVALIGFDVKLLQYPLIIAVTIMAYCWYSGTDKTDAVEVPSDFSKKRNKDKPRYKPVEAPDAAKADQTSGVSKDSKPAAAAPAAPASNPKSTQPIEKQQPKPQQQQQQQHSALQGSKAVAEPPQKQEEFSLNQSAYQVLQQIHPGTNIDNRATKLLVAMLQWTMTSIASLTDHTQLNLGQMSDDPDAASLMEQNLHFFAALEKFMSSDLAKYASSEVSEAVIKAFRSSSNSSAWSSADAGLLFDPCAIAMQCAHHDVHVSRCLAVAVSAATEYIAAEILELSGNIAIENANSSRCGGKNDMSRKMSVINIRCIEVAVQADSELRDMFRPFWSSQAAKAVHARFACESEEFSLNQSAYQVLQQIHPGTNIDNRATKLLVAMLQWTMTSIASLTDHTQLNLGQMSGDPDAASLMEQNLHFFAALEKFIMPGELAKRASCEVSKAVIKAFRSSSNSSAWSSADAGLLFDPCAIAMQCAHHDVHVSRCLAVAVSAATEYIAAEILELSGNIAIENANSSRCGGKNDMSRKTSVINIRCIEVAVQADSELRDMFRPFWSSQAAKAVHARFACASEESAAPRAACHHDDAHDGSDSWATEDDNGDSDGSLDGCDNDS